MDLSGGIDLAVDAAVSASTDSSSATPASSSGAESAATSPTAAPAVASGTDAQTTSTSSTDAPTAQASAETPKREDDKAKTYSPPPPEKWESVLANARTQTAIKTADEVWTRDLGVSPQTDRNIVRQHVQALLRDPRAYHAQLGQLLGVESQQPPAQARQPVARPQPTLRAEDGTLAYAAKDVEELLRINAEELEAKLTGQLAPLQQSYAEQRAEHTRQQAHANAQSALSDYRTWPGWNELERGIAEDMARDGRVTPESAYARRYKEWSKTQEATIKAEARKAVLAEIDKAPTVTSTVKPGVAAPPQSKSRGPRNQDEMWDNALRAAGMQ